MHPIRQHRWMWQAVVLLFCLGLFGCPKQKEIKIGKMTSAQLQKMLPAIRQERRAIKHLEGRAKLRVYQNGKRKQTIRLSYQVERPDRLHLQVTAAFGQPGLVVTCDGKHFAIHNLLQNQFIQGPAPRLMEFLGEYLPVSIPLRDLVSVLLGELPILSSKKPTIRADEAPGIAVLSLKETSFAQQVWLDVAQRRFLKTILQRNNETPVTLEYSGFRGKPSLPKRIQFLLPKKAIKVSWIFASQDAKTPIPAKNFQQEPPKDVPVRTLAR